LTITHEQLNTIPCDITLPDELLDQDYLDRVIKRQEKLAFDFREFMTRDQSFETVNGDRKAFYERVIEAAKTVSLFLLHFYNRNISFKFDNRCKSATEARITKSPVQYLDGDGKGVRSAAKDLCSFVDPRGILESFDDWRWPSVLLSFDEPQVLTDGAKEGEWTLFSELRRILHSLESDENSIFTLFLSTAGNFRLLSPKIKSDPSSRVVNEVLRPFHPITEISFDCLARPAGENRVSLHEVVQFDWIAHLGRPLYVTVPSLLYALESRADIE
jgi:hypothetical protein